MTGRITAVLILLSALSLFMALPQPFVFACALIQLFFLPGFVFSLYFLAGRVNHTDQAILSILLSPILVAMLSAAVNLLVGDIYMSVNIVLIGSYLLLAPALVMGRQKLGSEEQVNVPRAIFFVSFGYAALILIAYLVNDYLLIRSDSWYHAAVVREVMERGIPPQEPLLADFSIKYMWFYHMFQALWIKRSGLSLFHAMAFFNIINAFIFPYLAARFASYFTNRKPVMVIAALFAIAGLDSVSWILWPVILLKAFMGDVTGIAEIKRILATTNINSAEVIRFLKPEGTWQVNWSDKFLTITVFNYSLNVFLACLILMLKKSFLTDSRFKTLVTLSVMIIGVFLFHIVSGIILLYVIVGSSILIYLGSRFIYREKLPISYFYVQISTVLVVSLFALPYFIMLVSGGNRSEGNTLINNLFHLGWRSILTILFPLGILFWPARDAIRKLLAGRDHVSMTMVSWIVSLFLLCVFINIGVVGEKKLIYFLFIVLGPPIYVQIVEKLRNSNGGKRAFLVTSIFVLFLAPLILTFRGFMMDKPNNELWSRRYSVSDEDMTFFEWVENNTSNEAVIIEELNYHLFPVYAGRRNLYSNYNVIKALDYGGPKMDLYRDIQMSVFSREPISYDLIENMTKVGRELYVAVWEEDIEASPWLENRFKSHPEWFKEVYSSTRVSLYTLMITSDELHTID